MTQQYNPEPDMRLLDADGSGRVLPEMLQRSTPGKIVPKEKVEVYLAGAIDAENHYKAKLQSLEAKLAMAREALDGLKNEFGVVFYALCKRDGLGNVPPEHNAFYLAAKKALQSTPEDIKAFLQKVKDEAVREAEAAIVNNAEEFSLTFGNGIDTRKEYFEKLSEAMEALEEAQKAGFEWAQIEAVHILTIFNASESLTPNKEGSV